MECAGRAERRRRFQPSTSAKSIDSFNTSARNFQCAPIHTTEYLHFVNIAFTSIRQKVALELGTLALLATTFLLLFPHRNPWLDIILAGFALLCILATAGYTKNVIWAASPPPHVQNSFKDCLKVTLWITIPTALVFFLIGGILAYRSAGWPAVVERIFDWKILLVFLAYTGWAFIQQTLFQFYLLGRLLVLFPKNQPIWPILITGLGFSLVHLPDIWTALVTAIAGPIWTLIYCRYRRLFPLALSHAALGTAFYYGVCRHNLAQEWRSAISAFGLG
jgi:hypothetical protein